MDLRQLRYFLHVAKTENLTQASGRAWVSQSALSRQIKLLEDELGIALFERLARGVKLTEAGITLVRRAEMLLREADELKRAVSDSEQRPTGNLRIGTPTLTLYPFQYRSKVENSGSRERVQTATVSYAIRMLRDICAVQVASAGWPTARSL